MPWLSRRRQNGNLNHRIHPRRSNLLSTGLIVLALINCKHRPPALHGLWQDGGNQELPFGASQAASRAAERWGAILPALRSRSQACSPFTMSSGSPRTLHCSEQEHHPPYTPPQLIGMESQAPSQSKMLLQQPPAPRAATSLSCCSYWSLIRRVLKSDPNAHSPC